MSRIDDHLRNALDVTPQSDPEMTGNWSVYRTTEDGNRVLVEGDLPEGLDLPSSGFASGALGSV